MKFFRYFLYLPAALLLLAASCAKEESESYDNVEKLALKAWMTQNRSELLENYQPVDGGTESGYYVDVLDAGDRTAAPISDTACWVRFDFSGRDLSGNVVLTRKASEAYQLGTFTKYTHYVPYYRYCGTENLSLMEGTYLAMRNTLRLGNTYFENNKDRLGIDKPEIQLREGTKVVLYMPSRVVGSGVEGSGGYEGQFSLSARRPLIVTMEIRDTVKNPLEKEGTEVDDFCELPANGGLKIYKKKKDDDASAENTPLPSDPKDPNHPYKVSERWVSACDTVPQVYVNYRYDPARDKLTFPAEYDSKFEPYNRGLAALEDEINAALVKRFHTDEDEAYKGVVDLTDSVKLDGTAKIWYIGRFLDGFIFDTNIDEVKKIIYGEVASEGSAKSYTPKSGGMISAFYYTVPNLKFGQWAAMITTSTSAYGSSGVAGGTSSSNGTNNGYSSSYLDYLNYMNYANSYYGGYGGYGGYYGGYYDNYMGGGYNPYGYGYGYDYGNTGSEDTTVKKTVNTEIPPFTPLIFQIYVEPK